MTLDAQQLKDVIAQRLGQKKMIVVSHREPYIHSYSGENVTWSVPAGGVVTALDPVMRACGGTWIAYGGGDADRDTVDAEGKVAVPPGEPKYWLKRVWLTREEEQGYYYGFANQGLWPLCHFAYTRPRFHEQDWEAYQAVNRKFAQAVLQEAGADPAFVFIQDYHFALLPRMLREERPDLIVAQFWHIPWPNPEAFRICPWGDEILRGLLGSDLLGFQIQYHCNNFFSTVERGVEAVVDYEHFSVRRHGRRTLVRPFPISVDHEAILHASRSPDVKAEVERLRQELGPRHQLVGVGVDRLDYTKGIPERLMAIDRFLEKYPEYQKRFSFLQIGPSSRIYIPEYKLLNDQLYHLMVDINRKYGSDHWIPIRILKANYPREKLLAFFQLADLCITSSLHDGMNLVAKEFVSGCREESALILSQFTGAATELEDAIIVNPYHLEGFADAIKKALDMPSEERERRISRMRQTLAENNVYDWAAKVVTEISRLN